MLKDRKREKIMLSNVKIMTSISNFSSQTYLDWREFASIDSSVDRNVTTSLSLYCDYTECDSINGLVQWMLNEPKKKLAGRYFVRPIRSRGI